MRRVRIALLGCGTVGGGLVRLLASSRARLAASYGVEFSLARVLVRDLSRPRDGVERDLLTACIDSAIPERCDVVVELLGGIEPARTLLERALARGLPVVTANKALLAQHGAGLVTSAATQGVQLGFEGSVCGGVPIVRALRDGLAGDRVESVTGVLNGTCNVVLTLMERDGASFEAALQAARAAGFAEADPSLDIDGWDAAQKLVVLTALAFGEWVPVADVRVRGIRDVTPARLAEARSRGRVLRLVATAERLAGQLSLAVEPRELALDHPLAAVAMEQNAVLVRGDEVGELLFQGRGAGAGPTATAVLADLCEVVRTGWLGPAGSSIAIVRTSVSTHRTLAGDRRCLPQVRS
jgi:homoserine dehydrogenase